MKVTRIIGISILTVALGACSSGGSKKSTYDDGGKERLAILSSAQGIEASDALVNSPVILPRPYTNNQWAQAGGNPTNAVHHLTIADQLSEVWSRKIGSGSSTYQRLVSGPVVKDGVVYAMDTRSNVSAVNLANGARVWTKELKDPDERSKVGFGGGVAADGDKLYVTSGYGFVAALDASTGNELWRFPGKIPMRGTPTVAAGRVFSLTQDNQILVLDAETGGLIWDQVGIAETASMLGAASTAIDEGVALIALSSGELIAMQAANGNPLWQDGLTSSNRLTPLATLADIDGNPVIHNGRAYASSHAGRMVAIDMRTGERAWEADIASVTTPWIAGNYAFIVTVDAEIAAVQLSDGRVRWVSQMQRFKNQDDFKNLIKWNGPVLAGDRLILTSSHGFIATVSPYTGDIISVKKVGTGSSTAPIVVDNTLIVLNDAGELVAYR